MEEKKTNELTDEALDAVSGGISRRTGRKAACRRCEGEFPEASLLGGYCSNCLDELHEQGVYPPI
ncbi:MAG: hypothetical protein K5855_07225 [Oscillospiraceae bacterium]|jgi:hypothetical protein|nr:hypothetical protein [Oscillospiraceae bacterium]